MGTGNEARLFNGRGDEESPLQKGLVQCGEKSRILLRHFSMIVESLSPRNENKRKEGSATYEAIGRTGVLQNITREMIQFGALDLHKYVWIAGQVLLKGCSSTCPRTGD